jgi:N-ethylmaleimide reductase
MSLLFAPTTLGPLPLQNHLVMSPMTRNRATGNVPTPWMAQYYGQRASAGLIITEGTSPSPNGLGYPRIPGVFSSAQIDGWRPVAQAVHDKGGQIFMQLMHCGRIAHPLNLPPGAQVLAPSALAAAGEMFTDAQGPQPHPVPQKMTQADITTAVAEFAQAASNALAAGFDGVELHGANGYLLEQFLRPTSNQRTDAYGGSIEHRSRFLLEVVEAVIVAIGKDRVGIRLSPFGVFNDMPLYEEMEADYTYLAQQLNHRTLNYIHLVDHSAMGAPPVPQSTKAMFRRTFKGHLILSGGYDAARAEADLMAHKADLIAVGRPFLANPDLPARWQAGSVLNEADAKTFYTPGPSGYIDYPAMTTSTNGPEALS